MLKAIITDHLFPALDLQRAVIESAGFALLAATPNSVTEDDVIRNCGDADVLLAQWAPISKKVLEALPRVRGVVRYGIGVNNIDLEAARALGVGVANVPTYCIEEVSNHALAMILSLARRIPQDHAQIASGGWGIHPFLPIPAFCDLTLGLVGFGSIGRLVARKARVFGFRIVASDPYAAPALFAESGVERAPLEDLLASADIVSLHCPLVAETTGIINRASIATMRPGAILINTARGGVVKEADLIEALESGRIGAAGLDVFEQEPLPAQSPLRKLRNVLLTSHAASVSSRAVELLQTKAAEAARDFLRGVRPESALVWPETGNRVTQKGKLA